MCYMLAYQPVCYFGLKRVGSAIRKSAITDKEQTFHTKSCYTMYYDNNVSLRYNKWKASDNTRQLDNWIKLIHV